VSILFDDIINPDGALRKGRKGRKPKVMEMAFVVKIGGEDFYPDDEEGVALSQAFDEVHEQNPKPRETTKGRKKEYPSYKRENEAKDQVLEPKEPSQNTPDDPSKETGNDTRERESGPSDDERKAPEDEPGSEKKAESASEDAEQPPVINKDGTDHRKEITGISNGRPTEEELQSEVNKEKSGDAETVQPEVGGKTSARLEHTSDPLETTSKPQDDQSKEKMATDNDLPASTDNPEVEGEAGASDHKEPSSTTPQTKKKRGRPPWKHKSKSSVSATTDVDVSSPRGRPATRPRMPRRAVMGLHAHGGGSEQVKRRSSRDSPGKKMSLKEIGTDSELEDDVEVERDDSRGDRKKKRRSSRHSSPRKKSLKEVEPGLEAEDSEDPPPKKKTKTRSLKRPGFQKKKKPMEESATDPDAEKDSSSESYHAPNDDDLIEEESANFSADDNDEDDASLDDLDFKGSSRRSSRRSSGPPKKRKIMRRRSKRVANDSDPEDSLPISVVVASTVKPRKHSKANQDRIIESSKAVDNDIPKDAKVEEKGEVDDPVGPKKKVVGGDADSTKESATKSSNASEASNDVEKKETEEGESKTPMAVKPSPRSHDKDEDDDSPKRRGRRKGKQEAARTIFS
jgi:hypothetical protein